MKKTLSLILVVVFIFSGALMAGNGYRDKDCREDWKGPGMIYKMLDLTDEQQSQIHDIHIKYQKQSIPLRADLQLARLDLRETFSENDNDKEIKNAAEKVANIKQKLYLMKIEEKLEMRNVLTEEQLEKWQDRAPLQGKRHMRYKMSKYGDKPGRQKHPCQNFNK